MKEFLDELHIIKIMLITELTLQCKTERISLKVIQVFRK